jgi:DNA-binding transcriptional regulator/RsmH inhibitor MraZ
MLDESDNIAIYNYQTGLDVLAHCEYMMAENPGDENIAAAVERITGAAEMVNVEGNWRVPISELLRFHAQLDKEIVTVGVLNHAVLWSRERWEQAQALRLQNQDVRRTQAEILRAAASGIKKKAPDAANRRLPALHGDAENEEVEAAPITQAAKSGGAGRSLEDAGAGSAGGRSVATAASSGDGKRSPRVFALSQLGR